VNIGDDDISLLKIGAVRGGTTNFDRFRIRLAIEHAAFDVEHLRPGRIEVVVKLLGDRQAWRNNERAVGLECKRRQGDAVGLPAPDRQNDSDLTILLCGI
jgi:hypothetical protein